MIIDGYMKDYLLHYANELGSNIAEIISKDKISTEQDAESLLSFVDAMCHQSALDMKEEKMVLGRLANTYEAEKAAMVIQDFVEDSGFEHLIDDDLELE